MLSPPSYHSIIPDRPPSQKLSFLDEIVHARPKSVTTPFCPSGPSDNAVALVCLSVYIPIYPSKTAIIAFSFGKNWFDICSLQLWTLFRVNGNTQVIDSTCGVLREALGPTLNDSIYRLAGVQVCSMKVIAHKHFFWEVWAHILLYVHSPVLSSVWNRETSKSLKWDMII